MMNSSLISFFLAIIGLVAAQPQLSGYDYCQTLLMVTDTTLLNTTVYYQFCYSVRTPNIFFGVVCEIDGWCGVGVSTTGYMVGPVNNEPSDVYVGFRNSSNLPQVGDFIIRGRNAPSQCVALAGVCTDGSNSFNNPNGACSNNAVNVNVTKVNIANVNYTITEFSRPLAASDACDLAITPGAQLYILGAMGLVGAGNYPALILQHRFHSVASVPVTFNAPITSGLITTGIAGTQVTTSPVTSGAVTTAEVTTGAVLTTGLAPVTTAEAPVTTGLAPVTTAQAPVTSGLAPVTTGVQPPLTTGTTTGQEASDSSAVILGVGIVTAIALTF